MNTARKSLAVVAVVFAGALGHAPAASATVHEIVGQWCSGQAPLAPPGITGRSKADNFAKPLVASGFETGKLVPHTEGEVHGFLIEFNYDVPNAKVVGTGNFIVIGAIAPGVPLYLELVEPDPDFPAFKACPKLVAG